MKKLLLLTPVLALTGCTVLNSPQGKVLSVTTRGLYVTVASTDATTGTPSVKVGLGSQTVTIVPTGTNGAISIPNVTVNSSITQNVNPFNTSGSEVFATGNYFVAQTNSASLTKPVVPQ